MDALGLDLEALTAVVSVVNTVSCAADRIADDVRQLTLNLNRPHVYIRPTIDRNIDGIWTCWYDSVIGQGKTPQDACVAFDLVWLNGTNERLR